jgi:hypothetical protein
MPHGTGIPVAKLLRHKDIASRRSEWMSPNVAAEAVAPPELDDMTFARWRDFVVPTEDELRWTQIPWRTSFWGAVTEAQRQDRPILAWMMNGHPLACT